MNARTGLRGFFAATVLIALAFSVIGMYLLVLAQIGRVPLAVTTNLNINFMRRPSASADVMTPRPDVVAVPLEATLRAKVNGSSEPENPSKVEDTLADPRDDFAACEARLARVKVLWGAGWLAVDQGDYSLGAGQFFEQSLAIGRALNDARSIGRALHGVNLRRSALRRAKQSGLRRGFDHKSASGNAKR